MRPELSRSAVVGGRYRLDELLGRGGMGSVWQATQLVTRRSVALKFLHEHLSLRPEACRRFLREARAASAVDHPNVVEIYDVLELADTAPVIVMELLRGQTFAQRLAREHALSLPQALELLLPVISAVGSAHAVGVIHRDLKPENVFLAETGGSVTVKVLDFGIAKLSLVEDPADVSVTTTGTLLGTPSYMAPEQGFGESDVDHRADIWSIGAMLYEALSGGRPIEGDNLGQVLKNLLFVGITPIEAAVPELPSDVASLLMRMLAPERDDRPSDLREVREILSRHSTIATPEFGAPVGSSVAAAPKMDTARVEMTPRLKAAWRTPARTRTLEQGQAVPLPARRARGWRVAGIATVSALLGLGLWFASARSTPETSAQANGSVALAAPRTRIDSATAAPGLLVTGQAATQELSSTESSKRPIAAPAKRTRSAAAARPAASASSRPGVARPSSEGIYEDPPF